MLSFGQCWCARISVRNRLNWADATLGWLAPAKAVTSQIQVRRETYLANGRSLVRISDALSCRTDTGRFTAGIVAARIIEGEAWRAFRSNCSVLLHDNLPRHQASTRVQDTRLHQFLCKNRRRKHAPWYIVSFNHLSDRNGRWSSNLEGRSHERLAVAKARESFHSLRSPYWTASADAAPLWSGGKLSTAR
jgi:hypothetical protein